MNKARPGILAPVPGVTRFLFLTDVPGGDVRAGLRALREQADGEVAVVGIGQSLVRALEQEIAGLEVFPRHAGPGFDAPSTPAALWIWLRGEDRGDVVHRSRAIETALAGSFVLERAIDAFRHGAGLDLPRYEDGAENPTGDAAAAAALVAGQGAGRDAASFVAVQPWVHDMHAF